MSELAWYALYTRPHFEKIIASSLRGKAYEEVLPLYAPITNGASKRRVQVQVPVFPGYVFCRFDFHRRLPILATPGVIHIVGAGKEPLAIDETEIEAIRSIVNSGLPRVPFPYLDNGQRIQIVQGPLKGVTGILLKQRSGARVVVSITMLRRAVAVEIDTASVIPVSGVSERELIGAASSSVIAR